MNYNDSDKKPFDSTVCFTFFGSWFNTLERLEREEDRHSPAYMLFKAIANYALYGSEPGEEYECPELVHINAYWPLLEKEIDNNIARRKRGFASEQPNELHERIIKAILADPRASDRTIGKQVGCGKTTVNEVRKKYAARIQSALNGDSASGDAPVSSVVGSSDTYCGSVSDTGIYSRGQGQSGQNGQVEFEEADFDDDDELPF